MNVGSVPESRLLPNLDTFAKAAEAGSFTAAARALGLSQAAVSQRIQLLERALETSLFDRSGGRVLLTEAGRTLYAYAQQILDLHREARRVLTGRTPPPAGELDLAASSVPGEYLLPALLTGFGRAYPHVRVRAAVGDSLAVIARVERGEASVGLAGRKADNPHLEFRFLASDRMVLVAPAGHPLCRKRAVSVAHLAGYPLVLREAGSGLRHCFEKSLERAGSSLTDLRVVLELGSNEAIKEAVQKGVGVAILSAFVVQKEVKSGRLCARTVLDLHCDRDMFIVVDKRRVLSTPARLFLSYLESQPVTATS